MYHPRLIAARKQALLAKPTIAAIFPHGFPEYAVSDARALTAQILQRYDPATPDHKPDLSEEESTFVAAASCRAMFDAPWFLETFVWIDEEGHGLRPLYPLWESQRFVLDRLAALELQHALSGSVDGLLVNVLKARQLGVSTLAQALVAHRIYTQSYIRALAGSDVEEQATYLFRMNERIYDQLPYFLKPGRMVPYKAGRELHLDNGSSIKAAWGKTTRGALQAEGGRKGNIERGRSQPLSARVLTPSGWRYMGELRVGDAVIGANGSSTKVLGVFPQGVEDVYRVTFSDGAATECSGDHLWQVTTAYRRWKGLKPLVRTTHDLLSGGLYWDKPSGRMAKWFVPIVAPIVFTWRPLPIPAYTLGVYLGDGSTRTGALQIAARDPEIKTRVASELPAALKIGEQEYDRCWYVRKRTARQAHSYLVALSHLGLRGRYSYEKYIPKEYLHAAIPDRVALLQGLLDTDGWVQAAEGRVCFSTTSLQLAQDVRELVEGLGGVARLGGPYPPKKAHTRQNGQRIVGKRTFYRLSICLPADICPFSVPRKVAGLRPTDERKYFPSRAIVSIERQNPTKTQCIRVEAADQLYVTDCCIVTHNTNSVVHISELATWDNPEQLDSSLLPGVPVASSSLVLFESTAELAGDWWHRHWQACQDGTTPRAWSNIFIPWCVEPGKYSLLAPVDWLPSEQTLRVAAAIERDSAQWVGRTLPLNRDQLYWYEATRKYYTDKNQLHQFFKEFPSNPDECFQYAGRSVFTPQECEAIDNAAKKLLDVWTVQPSRDIAELRRLPMDDPDRLAQQQADVRRYPPPIATTIPAKVAELHPVPPGYGFRRLTKPQIQELPSLRQSVLGIWEYPRLRGRRRYILGVDVGDGIGQDYSVISVVREPTIEEPAEEVAQYVSNTIRPSELAFVVDAIGHFYCDEDGIEACAAVELNNHGVTVQDLLQLHLGYTHFYVWEVVDAADASARFTKRIGWSTTTRTRPILLEKFHDAVTTRDPISGLADFRLNSPITRSELRFFVTEGLLGEAEHAKGQHDDCIFAAAIGYYVAYRQSGGEAEPLAERRRRRSLLHAQTVETGERRDWRNSASSFEAAQAGEDDDGEPDLTQDADGDVFFDPRRHA